MPNLSRMYCTHCGESIYNCVIDGKRIPIALYFVVGQPDDTGEPLDVNGEGVKLPSFIREIMQSAVQRVELCVRCIAFTFGVKLVTAAEDPCFDADMDGIPDAKQIDQKLSRAEQFKIMHARTIEAIRIGRGDPAAVVPVPKPKEQPPVPQPVADELALLRAQLEEAHRQLAAQKAAPDASAPAEEPAAQEANEEPMDAEA